MTPPLPTLLADYRRGAISLDELKTHLREASTAQKVEWIVQLKAEIAAERVSESTGTDLLNVLVGGNDATCVADDLTRASAIPATLLRADATVRDARSVDAADDRTLELRQRSPETAARTLRTPQETLLRPSSHDQAAQPPVDRTQVIAERLVQTLDEAASTHHGVMQPGSVVKNRFVLEQQIGKGGMGLVFAAIDRRKQEAHDPNPRVAFKVLNADFQRHPQSLIALQREARKAQTLAHPNVVTVFDFDRDGDAVYMTMELLKGRSLEAFVREARGKGLPPAIVLPIIRGIAEGLAYAHRKGIVHSDLKPGNVFVLDDGTPKILDFGIARAIPTASSEEAPDIFDAGTLGAYTEAYATDEMVGGVDPHPADDMYALGLIGYELITGFHPYQRHSAPKARELGIKPPPLKGLKLREARALERCVSFDRKQRPQAAAEFLKAFRGTSPLAKAALAASLVLGLTAAYVSYENYRETSPAIPFNSLPVQIQNEFAERMAEGDREWEFYSKERNPVALNAAVDRYAEAYALHERNRGATAALNRSADAWLDEVKNDPQARREVARSLLQKSDYYRRYAPVIEAARE